jgi:hypothetical protein
LAFSLDSKQGRNSHKRLSKPTDGGIWRAAARGGGDRVLERAGIAWNPFWGGGEEKAHRSSDARRAPVGAIIRVAGVEGAVDEHQGSGGKLAVVVVGPGND